MVEVRSIRPSDWKSLKAIRLEALTDSPDAFCTTYEEASGYDDSVWIDRASVEPVAGTSMSVLAFDAGETVGLAVGVLCDDGVLDVVSVFVAPQYRGSPTAQELMTAVETWGVERGAVRAVLDVEAGNQRASAFYARLGYMPTGRRETYPGRVWLQRVELNKVLGSNDL
ncbi:MAG: hypothetical protein BMS9Abin12_1277 [Acidimicrobiia bacterium]|nr:MAG: hypothetical protein BMS9Abin12_1277 [Acidimicrobiia bacterium]